jgi:rhamnose transport system ATP-binding protein
MGTAIQVDEAGRPASSTPLVELRGVSKFYGPVRAIEDVDLQLRSGEIRCLAGENGAGKSTIIKVLTGAIQRDSGSYRVDGREFANPDPARARTAGIGVVYQELSLLPELSAQENILMGRLPSRAGFVHSAELRRRAREVLARVGLEGLDPSTPVADVSPAARQLIEVAKVLAGEARVVVLDEPTTALSGDEALHLLRLVARLRDDGVSVLYVTHRLEEMFEIGDRVTVLRDGRVTQEDAMAAFDRDSLIAAMVGRKIEALYPLERSHEVGRALLTARGLRRRAEDAPIDFEVRAGEIVGIGGLLGSGRTELMRALFGADPVHAGEIEVDGRRLRSGNPRRFVRAGLGLLTEDRKELGLLLELSIRENASIADLDAISRFTLISRRREASVVDRFLDSMRLRSGGYNAPVSSLSGGNQQKVLLARWLATKAKVLLFDEPTKGLDVGAKSEIYHLIGDLAADGLGVVVVSSYLPELLGLCDRIVVMRQGAIAGELLARGTTEEDVLRLASPDAAATTERSA